MNLAEMLRNRLCRYVAPELLAKTTDEEILESYRESACAMRDRAMCWFGLKWEESALR
jgi:hypothetical protein